MSVAQEITYAATVAFALLLWSWACGFVLASLSRRAFWITAFLFYCVVLDSWTIRMTMTGNIVLKHGLWPAMLFRLLPLDPFVIAFLFALVLGVLTVRKGALRRSTRLYFTTAGLALVLLLVWMESWFVASFAHWSGQPYLPTPFVYRVLPWLAGAWPVLLISLLRGERQKPRQQAA